MKPILICFVIPGVPKVQERPRKGLYGNFYSPSSKNQAAISMIALAARVQSGVGLLQNEVILTAHFYGLPKRCDLSNAVKLVEDAMNKVVYEDDRQVCQLMLYRHEVPKGSERTEVFVQNKGEVHDKEVSQ